MADLQTGLIFAGLQGMIDPPRPEAIEAVAGCKKAGIRVVMITGDHAVTAEAIAKQLGIEEEEVVVEDLAAKPLNAMTDEELLEVTQEAVRVLARRADLHREPSSSLTGKHIQAMSDMEFFAFVKEVLAALVKRAGPEGAVRKVLAGKEIETMSDATLFHLVQKVSVYARVAPHHKLRIRNNC
jgi:Ca2+-transporting ATPase